MEKVCRDARGRFEQLRSLLSTQTVSLSSRSAIFMEVSADMYNTFSAFSETPRWSQQRLEATESTTTVFTSQNLYFRV